MPKRLCVGLAAMGSAGLLTAIALTTIEGVKYRVREEQGLDPILAPSWVATATYAGLWVFALAVAGLAAVGIVGLVRRTYRDDEN